MKDNFSEKSKTWDENPLTIKRSDLFTKAIRKNYTINAGDTLMEFGCGTGLVGLKFARQVKSLIMIDTSPSMISVLKDKINTTNVQVICGDIREQNLKKSSINLVFSLMVFHHINNIPEILSIFYDALKENGFVIIGDLVKEDGSFHEGDRVEHNGFKIEEFKELFIKNNFSIVTTYKYHAVKKPDSNGDMKEYDQFILVAKKNSSKSENPAREF